MSNERRTADDDARTAALDALNGRGCGQAAATIHHVPIAARDMSVTQTYLGHNNKFTGTIQEVTVEVKGGCGLPSLG